MSDHRFGHGDALKIGNNHQAILFGYHIAIHRKVQIAIHPKVQLAILEFRVVK